MKAWRLLPIVGVFLMAAGCSENSSAGSSGESGDVVAADSAGDTQQPEIGGAPDLDGGDDVSDVLETVDIGPEIPPEPEPEPGPEGIPDGDGLIVHPESLEGLFIYGIGVDPQSGMAFIGNTPAGALAVVAEVELFDGQMIVRQWDLEEDAPVQGGDGVIETYPYKSLDDGRVRVDFEAPGVSLEVHLGGGCTYGLESFILAASPMFEDDLLTWTVVEVYEADGCGGGGGGIPSSFGMNVHFLRRYDANPDYEIRTPDDDMPFGFFKVETPEGERLTRLPYTGAGYEDGQVVYYLDPDFPEDLRGFLYDIFDHWNLVLEATAGNRPFLLKESPPSLVPWDPRYRVVDWDGSQSRGAIAPFIPHPVTGEMFDSDVIVWLGGLDELVQSYVDFFEANPDLPYDFGIGDDAEMPSPFGPYAEPWLPPDWDDSTGLPPRVLRRRPVPYCPLSMEHIHQLFVTHGMSMTTDEIEELIILDYISHEVGHNLGLRHNFKASIDKAHHAATITATSVMDYVMGMSFPGTYDADAMRYAYGDGAMDNTFLYCTDEDVDLDPGCARWDLDHPVSYAVGVLDALIAAYPPETPQEEIDAAAEEKTWADRFRQLRQFVNSAYEWWTPEEPVLVFDVLLARVLCKEYEDEAPDPTEESGDETPPDEEPTEEPEPGEAQEFTCDTHLWFRQQAALYLLYTKYVVQDEWYDFPGLDSPQIDLLFQRYFQLLTDPDQSMGLKQTIINKLPTSSVPGAGAFLQELEDHFEALEDPSEDEAELLSWIQSL